MGKQLQKGTQFPMWPVRATFEIAETTLQVSANPAAYQGSSTILPGTGNPALVADLPTTGTRSIGSNLNTLSDITADTVSKGIKLRPGKYKITMEWRVKNATTASGLLINLTDTVSSASTVRYYRNEGHFVGILGANTQQITMETQVEVQAVSTICIRGIATTASGTIVLHGFVHVEKIGNYPEP